MGITPTEIGSRIKAARKTAHLSQTSLAKQLDKTLRSVQKYESGEIEPSIAVINQIAKVLNVSPAELMGYQSQEIRLDTLADVFHVLHELDKKAGLRFEVDVKRPPRDEEWSCSLHFNGNDPNAERNADICLFLESYADERERVESYMSDQEYFDHWFETQLAYYANAELTDKPVEALTVDERIRRRNEMDKAKMASKKAADDTSGPNT